MLGVADREVLTRLTGAILAGDAPTPLDVLDAVSRQGFDLVHLCRDLLASRPQPRRREGLHRGPGARAARPRRRRGAPTCSRSPRRRDAGRPHAPLHGALARLRRDREERPGPRRARDDARAPRAAAAAASRSTSCSGASRELEKRLATGAPPPARGGGSAAGSGSGSSSVGRSREPSSARQACRAAARACRSRRRVVRDAAASSARRVRARPVTDASRHGTAPPASAPRLVAQPHTNGALALAEPELDIASASPSRRLCPRAPSPPPADDRADDRSARHRAWRALLARHQDDRPAIAATLELAAPTMVTRERIVLGFEPGSFEDGRAEESDAQTVLTEMAQAFFGRRAARVDVRRRGAREQGRERRVARRREEEGGASSRRAPRSRSIRSYRRRSPSSMRSSRTSRLPAQED